MKKILLFSLLGVIFLAVMEIVCFRWQYHRAFIVVSNESGKDISDLKIQMREGGVDVGALSASSTKRVRVFPHGESAFTITFRTMDGKAVSREGAYIESTGGYEVLVNIAPDYSVSRKTNFMRGFIILRVWKLFQANKN